MLSADAIKARAIELGFDLCGIAPATTLPELARLKHWLASGYAGEMSYLHKSAETRADIRRFLPAARSVIVTGTLYHTEDGQHPEAGQAQIARYAWGDDYHHVLAERLSHLVEWMRGACGEPFDAAIFVDKHHVQERVFARHAGLGWIGKNTCVISPEIGSWILLAGIAISLELPVDLPVEDQCGSCTLCLDACPTGALVDAYELDATRCISYLTIELEGPIPDEQRAGIADHLFGCDICQEVCPWNLAAPTTKDEVWQPRAGRKSARAEELWLRSDFDLHALVNGSAMTRTTMARLRRNLAVVLGNSGSRRALETLERPGHGVRRAALSVEAPVVVDAVAWARAQLTAARAEE
jgi:epoxyqueuosine reductase